MTISVILPTHDRPQYVRQAVESLLIQSHLPEELIVVSDGRHEVPPEIGQRVRSAGIGYRCERRFPPSLTASRNHGIRMSTGDILLLMDDDELLGPEYLAVLAELYEADTEGVIGGIAGTIVEPHRSFRRKVWDALLFLLGHNRWAPRRCAAGRVRLPRKLLDDLHRPQRLSQAGGEGGFLDPAPQTPRAFRPVTFHNALPKGSCTPTGQGQTCGFSTLTSSLPGRSTRREGSGRTCAP